MVIIADLSTELMSLINSDTQYQHLYLGFTDGGNAVVFFDNLSFGVSVLQGSSVIQEEVFPQNNFSLQSTDQEYVFDTKLHSVIAGNEYTISVWVTNAGSSWQQEFNFIVPLPPQPYPSWVWSENIQWWTPPVAYPSDGGNYVWNEDAQDWQAVTD